MKSYAVAVAIFAALFATIVIPVMPHIGHFNYSLDDAYIHLAVARNIAETGWFGVRPGEFVLLSSSPIFTLVLALLHLVHPSELWPLFMTIAGALLALFVANAWLKELTFSRRTIGLAIMGAASMIVPLALTGLEHTWHLALSLLFGTLVVRAILSPSRRNDAFVIACALPLVVLRYESSFLLASAALLLLWRKRYALAPIVVGAGVVPAVIVGAWSMSHGGTHIPSSVLVKGGLRADAGIGWLAKSLATHFWVNLTESPHVVGMIVLLVVMLVMRRRSNLPIVAPAPLLALLALGCMGCFMISSIASGFYRYELWLVWLGCAAAVPMFFEQKDATAEAKRHWTIALWFPAFFAFMRALSWTIATPVAIRNIHDQQIVIGDFLAQHHKDELLVVNDIGYITWKTSRNVVDYAGLATPSVTRAWRRGDFSVDMYDREAGTARIAILFPNWYPRLPERFVPVADLTIPDNVCHNDVFRIYALDPAMHEELAREMNDLHVDPPVTKTVK